MGMVERRAVAEFQERYYPALLKKVHAAAGYPVPVEVKWDTLALDKESDKYNTHWPDMYFEPLVAGLGRINKDDMGRAAIKDGIKKIVIQNEANNKNPACCAATSSASCSSRSCRRWPTSPSASRLRRPATCANPTRSSIAR
jgi:hypothetical protein